MSLGSSLRSPAEGEGNEGLLPPPEKDLESLEKEMAIHSSTLAWKIPCGEREPVIVLESW